MGTKELDTKAMKNWRTKVLIAGGLLGALVGLGSAYLFSQAAEKAGNKPEVSAGDGVRLGLLVLGLLRQVASLGEGGK